MPRSWASVAILGVALIVASCAGPNPGAEGSGVKLPRAARAPASRVSASMVELEGAWVELVRLASDDFAIDLAREPASAADPGAQLDAMLEVHAAAVRAAAASVDLYLVLDSVTDLGATASGLIERDSVGARRDALLAELALIGAGAVIAIYKFHRAATDALRERASIVRGHLETANDDELALHREGLGLDAAATPEECLAAFDALGAVAAARLASSLEPRITMESLTNDRIRPVDAMRIREATARASTQTVAAGVRLSVSLHNEVLTPGWGEALRAAGASEGTRLAVDAVATVADVEPGDLPDRAVTLLMAATSTEPVTIEEPPPDLTRAHALAILGGASEGDLEQAIARLAWDANGGRAEAHVPTRIHAGDGRFDDAGDAVIPIPDVGLADALVLSGSFAPRLERIDTAAEPHIVIRLGPPPEVARFDPIPPEIPGCPPAFVTRYDGPGSGGPVWPLCDAELEVETWSGDPHFLYECRYRAPDPTVTYCNFQMQMRWMPYDPAPLGIDELVQCEPGYVVPNPDHFIVEGRQINVSFHAITFVGPGGGVPATDIVYEDARALAQSWLEGVADMGYPCRR